jgi:flagellar export protein FliJ
MKKFAFRMDSALRWRITQEQLERARLQSLLADESRVQRDIDALEQARVAAVSAMQERAVLDANELRSLASYLIGADWKRESLREQLAKRRLLVEAQRSRVQAAEQQVRLLEKLKDKKKAEWQVEFEKDLETNAAEAWLASHFGPASDH